MRGFVVLQPSAVTLVPRKTRAAAPTRRERSRPGVVGEDPGCGDAFSRASGGSCLVLRLDDLDAGTGEPDPFFGRLDHRCRLLLAASAGFRTARTPVTGR
jgi:hypothetical protein